MMSSKKSQNFHGVMERLPLLGIPGLQWYNGLSLQKNHLIWRASLLLKALATFIAKPSAEVEYPTGLSGDFLLRNCMVNHLPWLFMMAKYD